MFNLKHDSVLVISGCNARIHPDVRLFKEVDHTSTTLVKGMELKNHSLQPCLFDRSTPKL